MSVPGLEAIHRDYAPRGVKFYYVYKSLAYPENNGYIRPLQIEERLRHVANAKALLKTNIPWLCDTMTNDASRAFGSLANSQFIIGPDGQVVRAHMWSQPETLRSDLEQLVGAVEPPTPPAELDVTNLHPHPAALRGVVPRLELDGDFVEVPMHPADNLLLSDSAASECSPGEPLFVKPRVQIERRYFTDGTGELYLGLFVDGIHRVHWNNLESPATYEFSPPPGVTITPSSGQASEVPAAADADPREFVLHIQGVSDQPVRVTVTSSVCDDAGSFCQRVQQEFRFRLQLPSEL